MFKRIPSGIPGLDEMIGGGFLSPSVILLHGEIGTGKSVISQQFIWEGLKRNQHGIYFCIDSPPEDIRENMLSLGWDTKKYENEEQLIFVDIFLGRIGNSNEKYFVENPYDVSQITRVMMPLLENYKNEARVVFDSVSSLGVVNPIDSIYRFLQRLRGFIIKFNCIGLINSIKGMHDPRFEITMQQIFGNVFSLNKNERQIYLSIEKMTKTSHSKEPAKIEITNEGIVVKKISKQ